MEAVPAIESPSNPLIREIARGLEDRTLLLLEGEKTILDAVSAGIPLEHVLHDASIRSGRLAALTSAQPRLVSRAVLERLAEARTPQHLLAFARRRDVPVTEILGRTGPVVFVFGIQDPGNLGAIVRVAEAAGAAGVLGAPGSADFFHPRAVRGSAGSVLRVPVSGRVSFEPFAADAHAAGRTICGAVAQGGEDALRAPLDRASVLVIGSEGTGLPAGAYRYLDRRLTIPMTAPVDSLNAAVATALLLYSPALRAPSAEA
jgi:TrmH family RNA methyltransferase